MKSNGEHTSDNKRIKGLKPEWVYAVAFSQAHTEGLIQVETRCVNASGEVSIDGVFRADDGEHIFLVIRHTKDLYGDAFENFNAAKRRKLIFDIDDYVKTHRLDYNLRIDLVEVRGTEQDYVVEYIPDGIDPMNPNSL